MYKYKVTTLGGELILSHYDRYSVLLDELSSHKFEVFEDDNGEDVAVRTSNIVTVQYVNEY